MNAMNNTETVKRGLTAEEFAEYKAHFDKLFVRLVQELSNAYACKHRTIIRQHVLRHDKLLAWLGITVSDYGLLQKRVSSPAGLIAGRPALSKPGAHAGIGHD